MEGEFLFVVVEYVPEHGKAIAKYALLEVGGLSAANARA